MLKIHTGNCISFRTITLMNYNSRFVSTSKTRWKTLERLLCHPLYSKDIKECQVHQLPNWHQQLDYLLHSKYTCMKIVVQRSANVTMTTVVTYLRWDDILCHTARGLDDPAHGRHEKEWGNFYSLSWDVSHLGGAQGFLGGLGSFHRSVSAVFSIHFSSQFAHWHQVYFSLLAS